jgi:putative DNA primase/helicase
MPLLIMQDVAVEPLDWLWPGRLLFGKYNLIVGDGGIGKSTITIDIAARLSRGVPLPDGTRHPACGTLLVMPEDGAGDTIRPRLENAGADLSRIGLIQTLTDPEDGMEMIPTIPDDVAAIETAIIQIGARLLVLDPLLNFVGDGVNEYRDKEVRRAMAPLISMCEKHGVALVGLMHVTKATNGNAKHRGNAAAAFMNLSRSTLYAANDPDIPECFVLAQSKTNLGPLAASLRYRLEGCPNGHARVGWEGVSAHTADSLNAQGSNAEERSELRDAEDFLDDALAGGATLVTTVKRQARDAGISEMTLRRAKVTKRVISKKARTQDGQWTWELPVKDAAREGVQAAPVPSTLTTLNTMTIFKELQEDSQDAHDSQGGQDVGHENVNTFPVAASGGKTKCVECQKTIIRMKGEALICKACLSTTSLAGAD